MTLTPADLDALDQALAAMTPGPWPEANKRGEPIVWHEMDGDGWTAIGPVHSDDDDNVHGGPAYLLAAADSLGMRALVNAAPALLAEVRRLREEVAKATESRDGWHGIACRDAGKLRAAARLDAGNAESRALAAEAERDRLAALLHGLHDAASDLCAGWPEGGCLVEPPCKACRWCIFAQTVEAVRAALATAAGKEDDR